MEKLAESILNQQLISFYPHGVFTKKGQDNYPEKYISFLDLIKYHQSEKMRLKKTRINNYEYGSPGYNYLKKRLPCVLFNKFSYNLNIGFLEENEIKPFDVDIKDNLSLNFERARKAISNIAIAVVSSTSKKGFKFFLHAPFNTQDSYEWVDKYKKLAIQIENEFNIKLDYAQGRIKQPFFISWQKDIFINQKFKSFS